MFGRKLARDRIQLLEAADELVVVDINADGAEVSRFNCAVGYLPRDDAVRSCLRIGHDQPPLSKGG